MDAMAGASGSGGVGSSGGGAASGDGTAGATNQAMPNPWGAPAASLIPMVGGGSGAGAGANLFAHASCGWAGLFEPARSEKNLGCRGCRCNPFGGIALGQSLHGQALGLPYN